MSTFSRNILAENYLVHIFQVLGCHNKDSQRNLCVRLFKVKVRLSTPTISLSIAKLLNNKIVFTLFYYLREFCSMRVVKLWRFL